MSTSGFDGNPGLMEILKSDRVFYLEPIFERPNTWAAKAEMKTNHAEFSGCSIKGKLYAIGGRKGPTEARSEFTSKVEEYNPKTDVWTLKADAPTPRKHKSLPPLDRKSGV